jgi:hypothetical protein
MQIKIMKCHYTFIRIAKNILKGKKNIPRSGEDVEQVKASHIAHEFAN